MSNADQESRLLAELKEFAAAKPPDYDVFLARLLAHFEAPVGTIHSMSASTGMLRLVAHAGLPPALLPKVTSIPLGKGMAGLAAERRVPVESCNLQTDATGDVRPGARLTQMQGSISVPFFCAEDSSAEKVVGVLGVAKPNPYEFNSAEKQLLSAAGNLLAASLAKLRFILIASLLFLMTPAARADEDYRNPELRAAKIAEGPTALPILFEALQLQEPAADQHAALTSLIHELIRGHLGDEKTERLLLSECAKAYQEEKYKLPVRLFALRLMGDFNTSNAMRYLYYKISNPEARTTVIDALAHSPNPAAGNLLLKAIDLEETSPALPDLLRALGLRRDGKATTVLIQHLTSERGDVAIAAVEALSRIPSLASGQALIGLMGTETRKAQLALVGVDMVTQDLERNGQPSVALELYRKLGEQPRTDRAIAMELRGIGRSGGAAEVQYLLERLAKLPPVWLELGGQTALDLGARLDPAKDSERLRTLYKQVASLLSERSGPLRSIKWRLRALGETPELTIEDGVVRQWWTIGGFSVDSTEEWSKSFFPETTFEPLSVTVSQDRFMEWQSVVAERADASIDLCKHLSSGKIAIAYALVDIQVESARDVVLEAGSDNGLTVWLNGNACHTDLKARKFEPGQDRIPVRLNAGSNRLLLKICRLQNSWTFQLRLVDSDGKPVSFKMR
ncbi:MAG: GAF domain-containing protein [Planctomycetota bacterium]